MNETTSTNNSYDEATTTTTSTTETASTTTTTTTTIAPGISSGEDVASGGMSASLLGSACAGFALSGVSMCLMYRWCSRKEDTEADMEAVLTAVSGTVFGNSLTEKSSKSHNTVDFRKARSIRISEPSSPRSPTSPTQPNSLRNYAQVAD